MLNHPAALALMEEHGEQLLARADGAHLDREVPGCPGWTVADLVHHVTEVWHFWASVVERPYTSGADLEADYHEPDRPADAELVDTGSEQLRRLLRVLSSAELSREVWTWTGRNRDAAWVARRMAHETVAHHLDLASALGVDVEVDPTVTADGVDEFLTFFAGARPAADAVAVGGSVHLHSTDAPGEWYVAALDGDREVVREHRTGDAAVRGPSGQLLRWLWRRDADVEVLGDAGVAERFRAFTDLS